MCKYIMYSMKWKFFWMKDMNMLWTMLQSMTMNYDIEGNDMKDKGINNSNNTRLGIHRKKFKYLHLFNSFNFNSTEWKNSSFF